MSFAVFGVSKEVAIKQARLQIKRIARQSTEKTEKLQSKLKKDGETNCALYRYLSELMDSRQPSENLIDEVVSELVPELMSKLSPKQLSPLYGMPSICEEFKKIARKHGAVKLITKQQVAQPDKKIHGKFKRVWTAPINLTAQH